MQCNFSDAQKEYNEVFRLGEGWTHENEAIYKRRDETLLKKQNVIFDISLDLTNLKGVFGSSNI